MYSRPAFSSVVALLAAGLWYPTTSQEPTGAQEPTAAQEPTGMQEPTAAPAPGLLRLTTERAVIFKDGHALLVKQAIGTVTEDGTVFTDQVPDSAVLGSFWAGSVDTPIRSMRAEWIVETETRDAQRTCETMVDLFRANQGRSVRLTLEPDGAEWTATILRVLENPGAPTATPTVGAPIYYDANWQRLSSWAAAPQPPTAGETVQPLTATGGSFVVVERQPSATGATQEQVAVPISLVRTMTSAELNATVSRPEHVQRTSKRLTFLVDGAPGQEVKLSIMYFTPGMRWIPTYRLSGDLVERGQLDLQAELLNELEDLPGVPVDLVVGVPHFRFGTTISPLSLERTMRDVLGQAAPQLMGQSNMLSNASFGSRSGELRGAGAGGVLDLAPELSATGEQDLFVYSLPNLMLPRGARAALPVWRSTVELAHLYTFDVDVLREPDGQAKVNQADSANSPLDLDPYQVWHQLELRNAGEVPWTTGAALILNGTLPLGQDLLTYTPTGAATLLPVTVAVDVRGNYVEEELSREPNAMAWSMWRYARIVKRGTVSITNFRAEASRMRVRVSVGGRVNKADGDPRIVIGDFRREDWQNGDYHAGVNNHSDVTWNLELEPGSTQRLEFEFEIFTRL